MPKILAATALLLSCAVCGIPDDRLATEERLSFQSHSPYQPRLHLNADVAMVYGIDATLPARIDTWRKAGYRIHVMTGVAWGQYQDYLNGKFDGVNHWDQAQTTRDGAPILHGKSVDIPYMSPGENYGRYLSTGVKRAIDAGAEAIHLEEPEFWARAGYEENFKREWKSYYSEEWLAPHTSPDAQYRASKLKYYLYRRSLAQVFDFTREYAKTKGRQVRCYVPTHSLTNYAQWNIVSPMSSLIDVGADGYIAQVWTGTARTPNVLDGVRKERTFETAFLEYGAMQSLVRASGRTVWFLHDPIEDNPGYNWADYKLNWEATVVASLLHPEVWRYEIMPWPNRVFLSKYPVRNLRDLPPGSAVERIGIPASYETELQTVTRALGDMKQPAESVHWELAGTQGIGVLVSDTMMFQRAAPQPSDKNLGSFYGLALPLLSRGVPVEPVQLEHAGQPGFLDRYKLLLLTYEGQKPLQPELHVALAKWVQRGGVLLVIDDDQDPYNAVREWWNKAPLQYRTPRQHLFAALGIDPEQEGVHAAGSGFLIFDRASPAALSYEKSGSIHVLDLVRSAFATVKLPWRESSALALRRGPYIVAAGLTDSALKPATLRGRFVDLFDSTLPVLSEVTLSPGKRVLLYDLNTSQTGVSRIVAAAGRIREEVWKNGDVTLRVEGISGTRAALRIRLNAAPAGVRVNGQELKGTDWNFEKNTLLVNFPNEPLGVTVQTFSRVN